MNALDYHIVGSFLRVNQEAFEDYTVKQGAMEAVEADSIIEALEARAGLKYDAKRAQYDQTVEA